MEMDSVPIDRGWAWLIVLGSFGMNLIVTAMAKCIGVLMDDLQQRYQCSMWTLTTIHSTSMALWCALAPISNALAVRFSARKVVFAGAILAAVGFIGSSFVQTVSALFVFQGIIVGTGYGLSYAPCHVEISRYFDKFKGVAISVCMSGAALGHVVLPLIIRYLADNFGLQGSFLVMSGIIANLCVFAMLLRPMSFYMVHCRILDQLSTVDLIQQAADCSHCPDMGDMNFCKSPNESEICANVEPKTRHEVEIRSIVLQTDDLSSIHLDISKTSHKLNIIESSRERAQCFMCNKKYFNWSLFRNLYFVVIVISASCAEAIWATGFMVLPSIAYHLNLFHSSSYAISFIGAADCVSRLIIGPCTDLIRIPRKYVFITSVILTGVTPLLAAFVTSPTGFIVVCVLHGVFAPFTLVLSLLVLGDEIGIDNVSSAFGFLYFVTAVGVAVFGQIAGALYDATKSWNASCFFMAAAGILSGILYIFLHIFRRLLKS